MKIKCQCPDTADANKMIYPLDFSKEEKLGMFHEPNKCKCTNDLKLYKRGNKKLWLCSCCHIFGDEEVENNKNYETKT